MFTVMPSDSKCFLMFWSTGEVGLERAATRRSFLVLKVGLGASVAFAGTGAQCRDNPSGMRDATRLMCMETHQREIRWLASHLRHTRHGTPWTHLLADRPENRSVEQSVSLLGQIVERRVVDREHRPAGRCDKFVRHGHALLISEDGALME